MKARPSGEENDQAVTASHALRATRFNRSDVEDPMVRRAQGLGLESRVEDRERTWLRRDFNIVVSGPQEAVDEFAEWLASLQVTTGSWLAIPPTSQ